ncbi:MAG: hypothetical protein KJ963_09445 [Bacteroidetes bacterium]|nr:hypothetical protein [Bacteroidota bacterium]
MIDTQIPQTQYRLKLKYKLAILLFSLIIYVFSTFQWCRVQIPTGDEPHFLSVTLALITNGNFNVRNIYEKELYKAFYPATLPKTDFHLWYGTDRNASAWYSSHDVGLPVLISPAYWMGMQLGHLKVIKKIMKKPYDSYFPRVTVSLFMSFLMALISLNVFLGVYELTGKQIFAFFTWVLVSFTYPMVSFAPQIYPETLVALSLIFSLRQIFRLQKYYNKFTLFLIGTVISLLPWFHIKALVLSVVFFVITFNELAPWKRQWRNLGVDLVCLCSPCLILGIVFVYSHLIWFGVVMNYPVSDFMWKEVGLGAAGLLFDQHYGLLPKAPVYFLAILGIMVGWRKKAILYPVGIFVIIWFMASLFSFWGAGAFPSRYLIPAIPLLSLPLGWAVFQFRKNVPFIFICAIFAFWGFLVQGTLIRDVYLLFSNPGFVFSNLNILFPNFIDLTGINLWLFVSWVMAIFSILGYVYYTWRMDQESPRSKRKFTILAITVFIFCLLPVIFFANKNFEGNLKSLQRMVLSFESEDMPHFGEIVTTPGSSNGKIVCSRGKQGYLSVGPFIQLPSGRYRLTCWLSVNQLEGKQPVASIFVTSDLGRKRESIHFLVEIGKTPIFILHSHLN